MVLHSLKPVQIDELGTFMYYENISKCKTPDYMSILYGEYLDEGRSNYSELHGKVKLRYELFDNNLQTLEIIDEDVYTLDEETALKHCYTVPTVSLKELKKRIVQSQIPFYQTRCAYCGIGTIDGYDHYLPKRKYPEFSVHPLNLVPCCSKCNEKKSTSFLDEDNNRIIFNPYVDVENNQVLKVNILPWVGIEQVKLRIEITDNQYRAHIKKLGIIEKYNIEVSNVFTTIVKNLIDNFMVNKDNISSIVECNQKVMNLLERGKNRELRERGINSVDYLVYDAFCDSEYTNIKVLILRLGNQEEKDSLVDFIIRIG